MLAHRTRVEQLAAERLRPGDALILRPDQENLSILARSRYSRASGSRSGSSFATCVRTSPPFRARERQRASREPAAGSDAVQGSRPVRC
jgi:hypothetical protein